MSDYLQGKQFIKEQASKGVDAAKEVESIYEEFITQGQTFTAARFIRDIYRDYKERISS